MRDLRQLPQLQAVGQPLDLPALRTVGYRQAWRHLQGQSSAGEFRNLAIFATRQLAKRQLTWLRGQADARWLDPQRDRVGLEASLALFLNGTQFASAAAVVV